AVQVVVEEDHAELEQQPAGRADAFGDRFVGKQQRLVLRHVQGGHFIGKIADRDPDSVVVAVAGCVDAHGSPRIAVIVESQAGGGANLFEGAVMLVVKHKVLHGVIGHNQVHPAVSVQIDWSY